MDEYKTTESDDLFDTDYSEDVSPDVSNTNEEELSNEDTDNESSVGEENEEALDLEESKSAKEIAKERQLKAWLNKINNGDKTIDDLPRNQRWLKPLLEKQLNSAKAVRKVEAEYDIDEIVERKIAEKEDKREFTLMKSALEDMDLTPSQKSDLSSEFKDLRGAGLSRAVALQKAMKIAGVRANDALAEAMMPPRVSTQKTKVADGENWWKEGDSKSRMEKLAELTDPMAGQSKRFS